MDLKLNEDDVQMIKEALGSYIRCLYWDRKLPNWESHCDGDCQECSKRYTIDKWLEDKEIK